MTRCLPILLLCLAASWALAAAGDDVAEVRLWVHAAYTGIHASQTKSRGAGPEASTTEARLQDKLTLTFEGTTTWQIEDWAPRQMTHNCHATANGGASWLEVERGVTPCMHARHGNDKPYVRTKSARWSYQVPGPATMPIEMVSPAGTVAVTPTGQWMLVLNADPNTNAVEASGSWFDRVSQSCCGTEQDDYPVDRQHNPPPGVMALHKAVEAHRQTFGGGGKHSGPIMGQWDVTKKGFFASGHLTNEGGDPNITLGQPPPNDPTAGYFTGTEAMTWSADISYTISYTLRPPPVECVIEPDEDYDKWLPAAGANEDTLGAQLGVTARLHVKGQPDKLPIQKAKFRFELVDTSQEPGVALNLPLQGARSLPDLKFVTGGSATPSEEGKVAESPEGQQSSHAVVGCYDYGAYGKLRVTATLDDGSIVYGHLKGQPGQEELRVPLDDNDNHVADTWEKEAQQSGDDKETSPALDNSPGDGLSFYEEYRGLVHKGQSVRLDPSRKDLVIVNEVGATAGPGLKLFESASGIHVVELSAGELDKARIVNPNFATANLGLQCALRLVSRGLGEGIIGKSLPDRVKTSPCDCDETAINSDLSFLPAGQREDLLAVGIAHEIGHSLGAQHHGDSGPGTTFENVTVTDANTKVFGVDGAEITQRPYTLPGLIEGKSNGGECSGPEDCVMRNSSFFQWIRRVDNMGALRYYAVPPTAPGSTFCQSPAGTGINAGGDEPRPYFGNSADGRGDCATHLRVRDQ